MIDFIINTIIYFVACIPTFIGGKLFHTYFAEKEKKIRMVAQLGIYICIYRILRFWRMGYEMVKGENDGKNLYS